VTLHQGKDNIMYMYSFSGRYLISLIFLVKVDAATFTSQVKSSVTGQETKAQPRTGLLQNVLNFALESPLWKNVLVPQARANIVKTAEENGIQWNDAFEWIRAEFEKETKDGVLLDIHNDDEYADYYRKPFHAYEKGNLCWDAAFEQELASRAVGARNFPAFGDKGEDAFRSAFEQALISQGATCPDNGIIVDLGCGTGAGTRRLADLFPKCGQIIGLDLSPYFIAVGEMLLKCAPASIANGGKWVTTIQNDPRLSLKLGDATATKLPDNYADVVNVGLVVHELPLDVACSICDEAFRILKPGGQLWLYEMDFDSPGFSQQRSNPLLFSLIRSTEPWLDVYADNCDDLRNHIYKMFANVDITAATGRHYALVATKATSEGQLSCGSIVNDDRFDDNGIYRKGDTHLKTWESKQ